MLSLIRDYRNPAVLWGLTLLFTFVITACGSAAIGANNRGFEYYKLGQYDRAIQDYDEAIRLDPQLAVVYNNRGLAYNELGQYERAIKDFGEAIRLDPKDADAYRNRGLTYEAIGKSEEAERDFAKAKELPYE